MNQRNIPRREIAKEARKLLKEGMPKQEVFEVLVEQYKYSKDVATILSGIPSLKRSKRYHFWNIVLLILIIILELHNLLYPSLSIIWYGLLIYIVATKMTRYYFWIPLLSFIAISVAIYFLFSATTKLQLFIGFFVLAIYLPAGLLSIWLVKKLCPSVTEKKEMYTNEDGENRMKLVYDFNDELKED
ncbi:MAG: hypothetical protein IPO63_01640 [Bacteroidetes bacterium]|nr:hypothetical protein [Bacteroidota bacterium]